MVSDILRWWLTVELFGLAGLPLAWAIFRRFPDRGYSFAKPLGILLVSYSGWLLAMLNLASFSTPLLVFCAILVFGLGAYATFKAGLSPRSLVRDNAHAIVFHEVLFALATYVGLVIRWRGTYGTQINHTETPMDFAFLNGILASSEFPPQDPWLAGYPINYYYFGYVMVAALTRLSGVISSVAFNLASTTIFALAATGIAGIVWNLVAIERAEHAGTPVEQPVGWLRLGARLFPALATVVLVLIAGNQVAALQWLTRSERVVALRGGELVSALSQGIRNEPVTLREPLPVGDPQDWGGQTTLPQAESRRAAVNWWWPSRAVWDDLRDGSGRVNRTYTITEFPFFSFTLGDLHPHVLALPWTLLAVALALNLFTRDSAPEWIRGGLGRIDLFVTGVTLGGLYAINSWDLPTYLLLYLGALLLLYMRLAPDPGRIFWAHLLQQAGVLLVACWLLWLPFHMTFVSLVGGNGLPIGLSRSHTPLAQFVVVFGLFAVPLLAFVVAQARERVAGRLPEGVAALVVGLLLIAVGIVLRVALLFLLPFGAWVVYLAYRRREERARSFALWTIALGALVVFGTEVIYLRDVFEGSMPRMNTLFKFYYQVWMLWGTIAGFALYVLARRPRAASLLWGAPFVVLLTGAMVYPVLVPRRGAIDRTLDGQAYVRTERPGDAAAIDWIKQNVPGNAIVLEAPSAPSYDPSWARIATATGRPTLIGWRGHENQWRGGQPEVLGRLDEIFRDAETIYTTTDVDEARELIDAHKIAYVYVGATEQRFVESKGAPREALTKFGDFMDVAWTGEGATIYRKR